MIFITGDLHGEKAQIQTYIETLSGCTKEDILIITGDFGLPWYPKSNANHFKDDKLLDLLRNAPFTTCFIDGNHENFTLLYQFPIISKWGGKVHDLNGIYHLIRGEIYEIEGHSIFTFGGATSIDKQYRTPDISWWELENATQEEKDYALQNLAKHNFTVDYVITHQAPEQFYPLFSPAMIGNLKMNCMTQGFLTNIANQMTFKKWYFGHYHDDNQMPSLKARLLYDNIIFLGE